MGRMWAIICKNDVLLSSTLCGLLRIATQESCSQNIAATHCWWKKIQPSSLSYSLSYWPWGFMDPQVQDFFQQYLDILMDAQWEKLGSARWIHEKLTPQRFVSIIPEAHVALGYTWRVWHSDQLKIPRMHQPKPGSSCLRYWQLRGCLWWVYVGFQMLWNSKRGRLQMDVLFYS